jgi:sialate O-acetylesterase
MMDTASPMSLLLRTVTVASLALFASIALPARAQAKSDAALLHVMFQDHAVLQREQPLRIWGRTQPGETVSISFAGKRARGRADDAGRWEVRLPALKAGGPHTLAASSSAGATQTVNDVLVGDVWLCSGQSNMELPVWRSLDARSEIAGADNGSIRLLTVPQSGSVVPQESFSAPTRWQTTTSDSLRDFSATCFYFARELQKTVDVPMGLISAAWGGAAIQAWMSGEALTATGHYHDELEVLEQYTGDPAAAIERWGEIWSKWWHGRSDVAADDEPWSLGYRPGSGWRNAPRELGPWERWGVPALSDFNGTVWLRTTVKLTAQQAAQEATLALGPVDEMDMTWVNGRAVGSTYGWSGREYRLPDGVLREGDNLIAINVLDTYRDGGLTGPASANALRLKDGTRVALDGAWKYRVLPGPDEPPHAPWQGATGLSTLYNGMIAPLGTYGLRGFLWYQGESNTTEPQRYRDLLRGLHSGWQARFGAGLPMLIVQLAGYGKAPTQPGESDWAAFRESQRLVAAEDPRRGLAVTIDIGDRYDLHPPNKQEVGRRLARAARHVIYGEKRPPSGPVPTSARRDGDAVVVNFGDVSERLVAYGAENPIGFELCGTEPGTCRYATAQIRGNDVVLRASLTAPATRVRYGWADSPVVTLFDGAGLPAGPFEIPVP